MSIGGWFPVGLMPVVCFWAGHDFRIGGLFMLEPWPLWTCARCKRVCRR